MPFECNSIFDSSVNPRQLLTITVQYNIKTLGREATVISGDMFLTAKEIAALYVEFRDRAEAMSRGPGSIEDAPSGQGGPAGPTTTNTNEAVMVTA